MTRSAVIQRVTYKGVLYDPDTPDAQVNFLAEAKKDMAAAGTWAPGRSENIIKTIGKTTKTIENVGALGVEEQSYWKAYDVAINTDLQILVAIQRDIDAQITVLEREIPRLKTDDVSVQVNAAVAEIKRIVARVPSKWGLKTYGVSDLEADTKRLIKIRPWALAETIRQKTVELAAEVELREQKAKAQASAQSGPPAKIKPSKTEKRLEKELTDLNVDLAARDRFEEKALASVATMRLVKRSIEEDIRVSAAQQYDRGRAGHTSVKSSMKKKKFYLGEIATTERIKLAKPDTKARGVLWAKPWAPGVNTAFLEGGADVGAVYKLATAIPDNLKAHIVAGDHAAFKAAVSNQATDPYRPFWHGVENRFTTYTDELTFLMQKGYRLHEFRRKNGKPAQQLLVHPSQLAEVTAAYDGR